MNRLVPSIAALLLCNLWAMAQSGEGQNKPSPPVLSFEHEDKCGSPLVESQLWQSFNGTVIKVVGADTIIVLTEGNKRKRVSLAAVNSSGSNNAARRMLTGLLRNRRV